MRGRCIEHKIRAVIVEIDGNCAGGPEGCCRRIRDAEIAVTVGIARNRDELRGGEVGGYVEVGVLGVLDEAVGIVENLLVGLIVDLEGLVGVEIVVRIAIELGARKGLYTKCLADIRTELEDSILGGLDGGHYVRRTEKLVLVDESVGVDEGD